MNNAGLPWFMRLTLPMALIGLLSAGAEVSATSISLTGGSLEIGTPVTVVENAAEHINFPFVKGWRDGVIWSWFTVGTQGSADQEVARLYSPDGGLTWQTPTFFYHSGFGPSDAAQLDDGRIVSIYGSQTVASFTQPLRYFVWNTSTTPYVEARPSITFPFQTTLRVHRSLVLMPDGRWIACAYGQRNGQFSYTSFTIVSSDQGQSWSYLSTIATPATNVDQSGPNETAMTLLADGTLLAFVRQGHGVLEPLLQSKSFDGGQTWSQPTVIDTKGGLNPEVIRLANNTLVASYGRRFDGVYLLADFTGTGDHWQQVRVYDGVGSEYTSLFESKPNQAMLYYDVSGYGSRNLSPGSGPNRLVYSFALATRISSWGGDRDGNWSQASNWNPDTVPNTMGDVANFGTIITAARSVTLDAPQTVGGISFDNLNCYTINGSSTLTIDATVGNGTINVSRGSHTISAPLVLADSAAVSVAAGQTLSMQHVRGAGLTLSSGAMKMIAGPTPNAPSGTSKITSLNIAVGATLDLSNNSLIVDYTAVGTLVGDIRQMLQSGKLTTNSAGGKLGYADNAVTGLATFSGQVVDSTSLLIKFTYGGDANLDGQVDISDLGALATAWQTSNVWTGGDFDYSGFVDISDLGILATNWQLGVDAPLSPSLDDALASLGLSGVSIPEPTTIVLLALCLAGVSTRRHRRSAPRRRGRRDVSVTT